MSTDGQRTKWRRNITKNFNRRSKPTAHEHYRQTTNGGKKHSEREVLKLKFNFFLLHVYIIIEVINCGVYGVDYILLKS